MSSPCDDCLRPKLLNENIETINVFHACDTQWRYSTRGIPIGLEYPALKTVMDFREIADKKDLFHKIKLMESEVLKISMDKLAKDNDN